jgi:hypothetical protein
VQGGETRGERAERRMTQEEYASYLLGSSTVCTTDRRRKGGEAASGNGDVREKGERKEKRRVVEI